MTIRPNFIGTVLNFDDLSLENYEVSQEAEMSRILNPIPILSGFECSVMSNVAVDYFDVLIPIPNSLSSDAFF